MATALTLYEEVKHEISTQTKQRYGFDIFDLSLNDAVSAAKIIYDEKKNKSSNEENQTMSVEQAKELAELCGIKYWGIAIGSWARKIVKEQLVTKDFWRNEEIQNSAIKIAKALIMSAI